MKLFYLSFVFIIFIVLTSCGDSDVTPEGEQLQQEEIEDNNDSSIEITKIPEQPVEPIPSTSTVTNDIPELNIGSGTINTSDGVSSTCTKGSQTKTYVLHKYPKRNSEGLLCYLELPGKSYYQATNEPNFCEKKLNQALQQNQQAGFVCSNN